MFLNILSSHQLKLISYPLNTEYPHSSHYQPAQSCPGQVPLFMSPALGTGPELATLPTNSNGTCRSSIYTRYHRTTYPSTQFPPTKLGSLSVESVPQSSQDYIACLRLSVFPTNSCMAGLRRQNISITTHSSILFFKPLPSQNYLFLFLFYFTVLFMFYSEPNFVTDMDVSFVATFLHRVRLPAVCKFRLAIDFLVF